MLPIISPDQFMVSTGRVFHAPTKYRIRWRYPDSASRELLENKGNTGAVLPDGAIYPLGEVRAAAVGHLFAAIHEPVPDKLYIADDREAIE